MSIFNIYPFKARYTYIYLLRNTNILYIRKQFYRYIYLSLSIYLYICIYIYIIYIYVLIYISSIYIYVFISIHIYIYIIFAWSKREGLIPRRDRLILSKEEKTDADDATLYWAGDATQLGYQTGWIGQCLKIWN